MISLFDGIEEQEMEMLLSCLAGRRAYYEDGEYILLAGDKPDAVGLVVSGSVFVLSEDFWGNRTILARVERGGLFGEAFSFARVDSLPVNVVASGKAEILFVNCERIITVCPSACEFHNRLIQNMLKILAEKNITLTQKIGHMARRSTREKLLSYLSEQAKRAGTDSFAIPLNRQELADYLAVDRSAMSKELGRLKEEGQISFHKNQFRLLKAGSNGKIGA